MAIDIKELTGLDEGRWVTYTDAGLGHQEIGRLKSWNDKTMFVVFQCDNRWNEYRNYTGQSCNPADLSWNEDRKDAVRVRKYNYRSR